MKNILALFLFALNLQSFYEVEKTSNNGIIFHNTNQNPLLVGENVIGELLNDLSNFQQRAFEHFDGFFDKLIAIEDCTIKKRKQKLYKNLKRQFFESVKDQPLFLLSECGSRNKNKNWTKQCPLERHFDPCEGLRHRLFLSIIEKLSAHSKGRTVIFYASGGALFEMQVLAGFLEKGLRFSNVILIDPDYSFSAEDALHMNLDSFHQLEVNTLRKLYRHIQLCHFVWSLNTETRIFIYKNSADYLSDVNAEQAPQGSMLIAMDPIAGVYNTLTGIFSAKEIIITELNFLKNSLDEEGATAVAYRLTGFPKDVDNERSVFVSIERRKYCAHCENEAQNTCSLCQSTLYCTKEHQTMDWPHHKQFCKRR